MSVGVDDQSPELYGVLNAREVKGLVIKLKRFS